MTLLLADPRNFSQIYPDSNLLINQALHDKAQNDTPELMQALLGDLLKQGNDQLLSVAYNLTPDQWSANYIWNNLQDVINNPQEVKNNYWLIPVILVAGSNQAIEIKSQLNPDKILALLQEHKVIDTLDGYKIGENLYNAEQVFKLKPSQIYSLQRQDVINSDYLGQITQISNQGENVYLTFISCSTNKNLRIANFEAVGMSLMKYISEELATDGLTLFPIPFPPCRLSNAALIGEYYRKEIAITLALGNQVKKLRLNGAQPFIRLSTQENNIHIELMQNDNDVTLTLFWSLQPADDFVKTTQTLENLFIDMQLNITYKESIHE